VRKTKRRLRANDVIVRGTSTAWAYENVTARHYPLEHTVIDFHLFSELGRSARAHPARLHHTFIELRHTLVYMGSLQPRREDIPCHQQVIGIEEEADKQNP
jgi:hypothetical protein